MYQFLSLIQFSIDEVNIDFQEEKLVQEANVTLVDLHSLSLYYTKKYTAADNSENCSSRNVTPFTTVARARVCIHVYQDNTIL